MQDSVADSIWVKHRKAGAVRLEVDPAENRALMLMMELLVQDFSYSSIVSDLNEKGLRMRGRRPWNRVALYLYFATLCQP